MHTVLIKYVPKNLINVFCRALTKYYKPNLPQDY